MIIPRIIAAFALLILLAGPSTARAADIGGPFDLVDHHGNNVSQDSYPGKYQLIFFGYTYCPDVCPTELLVLGQTLDLLGPDAARVQALFMTVDPARDTVDVLAEYIPNFHPDLIGLTGTPEQVAKAAKAFRVFYRISPKATEGEEYLVDHTSLIYLMEPAGEFASHFVYGQGAEVMARTIAKILAAN
jgi:protein SCO1/2